MSDLRKIIIDGTEIECDPALTLLQACELVADINTMDTNDDQLISQNEMEMFGGTVLTLIDTDEDGKITREEQSAFQLGMVEIADFRERRQAYDAAQAIVFDIFDRDSDGVISREEHMTGYRRAHTFADFDEDGQLSMSEYLNGFIFNIALRNALSQR